jgi:hypothetical protein
MEDLATLRHFLAQEDPKASAALESVVVFEQQDWVTVFHDENDVDGGDLRMACFLRPEGVEQAITHVSFDLGPGEGLPGFMSSPGGDGDSEYTYLTAGAEGVVPLIYNRNFSGPFPRVVELAEDFRLFWDLYEDRATGKFVMTDEVGDTITVAEWCGDDLCVNKRYLRRYQAARQFFLVLQVVVDRRGGGEIDHLTSESRDVSEDSVIFAYHGGDGLYNDDRPNFTRLLGKRIIPPPPIERSGVWPYEEPREYESFIVGLDEEGDAITHTCNPDTLANYFGKNPDAPHYLTPVFFTRNVLDTYYADSDRYQVEDGYLREVSTWGLRMDNAMDNHVAVFLGDLGSDIRHSIQRHWRSFNVAPPGQMSETAIRRSFLGQFYDSDRVEHRLFASYRKLIDAWRVHYGWPLYKPLHEGDAHVANSMHVPTNPSFGQFDDQIIRLAKLVVDSLNEADISLATTSPGGGEKGIAKLRRLLGELGVDDNVCGVLGRVQGARTRSAAHKKGGDFDPLALLDGAADLPTLFADLLEQLIEDFDALAMDPPKSPAGAS